jgi:hypothetical protein
MPSDSHDGAGAVNISGNLTGMGFSMPLGNVRAHKAGDDARIIDRINAEQNCVDNLMNPLFSGIAPLNSYLKEISDISINGWRMR